MIESELQRSAGTTYSGRKLNYQAILYWLEYGPAEFPGLNQSCVGPVKEESRGLFTQWSKLRMDSKTVLKVKIQFLEGKQREEYHHYVAMKQVCPVGVPNRQVPTQGTDH